jgi:hypothetical protein
MYYYPGPPALLPFAGDGDGIRVSFGCFEGVPKWIDAGLYSLLASAQVWKLEVVAARMAAG